MNLSRRSILTGLIAAPAVIAIDNLMPVRLWVPTIYGDAIHDDWEGLTALVNNQRVNIKARIFPVYPSAPELGMTSMGNSYLLSKPLEFRDTCRRDHFVGDRFLPTSNFPEDQCTLILGPKTNTAWEKVYVHPPKGIIYPLF